MVEFFVEGFVLGWGVVIGVGYCCIVEFEVVVLID